MKPKIARQFILLLLCGSIILNFVCNGSKHEPIPDNFRIRHDTLTRHIKHRKCDTLFKMGEWNYNAVMFMSPLKGIAVGDNGSVIISRNGGNNWQMIKNITSKNLYGVCAFDTSNIIAVGESGKVMRSKDGGYTWFSVQLNTVQTLRTFAINSTFTGYAAGDSGIVYSTTDRGVSWSKLRGNSTQSLYGLSFNDQNNAVIVGDNGLILLAPSFTQVFINNKRNLRSVHFPLKTSYYTHENIGFAVGDSIILTTTNGGFTWIKDIFNPAGLLKSVFFTSRHSGYAVGNNGTILRYKGHKWKLLPQLTKNNLNAIDNNIATSSDICVGDNGEIGIQCPEPVTETGYTVTATTSDCEYWIFTLTVPDNTAAPYQNFRASSSCYLDLNYYNNQPDTSAVSGWAVYDHYGDYGIGTFSQGRHQLPTFKVISSGEMVYITCCLTDDDGVPWLLDKFECGP